MSQVGRHEKEFAGILRRGFDIAGLRERPELWPELEPYWTAFFELHAQRTGGLAGPAPIGSADLRAALVLRRVPGVEWPEWIQYLTAMDRAWLTAARAEAEPKPED